MSKIFISLLVTSISVWLMSCVAFDANAERRAERGTLEISQRDVSELHDRIQGYLARQQVANFSFGVWQNGQLVTEGDYGSTSPANPEPVSDTTIYRIQSMTKPITAVGFMILLERGHFSLSDPITKFLPEFKTTETLADYDEAGTLYTYRPPNPPTMEQLLSHTSGLAYWQTSGGIIDQRILAAGLAQSRDTDFLVRALAEYPYIAMPGSEWNYSFASDMQGAIIERITGQSLASFLELEVFQPLGMTDTGFHVPAHKGQRISAETSFSSSRFEYVPSKPSTLTEQSKIYFEGGHGLYSTRRDYLKFLDALRGNGENGTARILSAEALEKLKTNAIKHRGAPGPRRSYGVQAGLGFGLGVGLIEDPLIANLAAPKGTYYWQGALGTFFWVDPVNDLVFVGMLQSQTKLEPDLMANAMDAIYGDTYLQESDTQTPKPPQASDGSG